MRNNPQREFPRHAVQVPLEVDSVGHAAPQAEEGINVGFGGLAFVTATCPSVGEILRIRIPTVKPVFDVSTRVVWCRSEAGHYLVGVRFLDSTDAFRSRMVQQVCSIENYRKEVQQSEGRELTPQEAAAEWIAKNAGRFPDTESRPGDESSH